MTPSIEPIRLWVGRRRRTAIGALAVALLATGITSVAAGEVSPVAQSGSVEAAEPFTFLVIPDTQNYAGSLEFDPIFRSQTNWIADRKDDLNLAFVAHLGDIVDTPGAEDEWKRASAHLKVLDDAGVPNSVLPGNHDFDRTTGKAPLFHRYFPVSRYSAASWNSSTVSYGGYFGQNQFGPDPADRQNMNNYALFRAAGLDYLVLNLEYNAQDVAVDWAKRVLAAHPRHRVILATHSYVDIDGNLSTQIKRTDGNANSGKDLWDELVSSHCSIFLVVSGHFHQGARGEARRTDTNTCGGTVTSVLSDYQSRSQGGEGWLRYYAFVPQSNEIRAYTYSPHLGRFETDSGSQFTIPHDMTVDVPPTTVEDNFERSSAVGWGRTKAGVPWTISGGSTNAGVRSGTGQFLVGPGRLVSAELPALGTTDTDVKVNTAVAASSDGPVYSTVSGRVVGADSYGLKLVVQPSGTVTATINRGDAAVLTGGPISGLQVGAGQKVTIRFQVSGKNPTTLRAKVWLTGTGQPADWLLSTTDATAALQTSGTVRLSTYLSRLATTGPVTVRWDDLIVNAG